MSSDVSGDSNRGVNWFEGGRRISKLLIVIVLGIGAFALINTTAETATLFTTGPGEPWQFRSGWSCLYPNDSRFVSNADASTAGESVQLCFEALENGKIPYAIAPEPKEAARAGAQQGVQDNATTAPSKPSPIRSTQSSKWYSAADLFDDQVKSYEDQREKSFRLTPEMAQQVRQGSSSRLWAARRGAFRSAAPWVFGFIAFIWVFTAVIGWIIRGFAGVPKGSDFRALRKD